MEQNPRLARRHRPQVLAVLTIPRPHRHLVSRHLANQPQVPLEQPPPLELNKRSHLCLAPQRRSHNRRDFLVGRVLRRHLGPPQRPSQLLVVSRNTINNLTLILTCFFRYCPFSFCPTPTKYLPLWCSSTSSQFNIIIWPTGSYIGVWCRC